MKKCELRKWPLMGGDFEIGNPKSPVSIATLASSLPQIPKSKFAIIGQLKTENLGVERVIINTLSNPNIRFLILCGKESRGHYPGHTILMLIKSGLDERKKVVSSKGAFPYLENISKEALEIFKKQVEIIDKVGVTDPKEIEKVADECIGRDPGAFSDEPFIPVEMEMESSMEEATAPENSLALHRSVFYDYKSNVVYTGE